VATCPSTTCEPGVVLLGVVGPDGRLRYVSPALAVDALFVAIANEGRPPEKRFRFAGECVEDACEQWSDGRCRVIDGVLANRSSAEMLPTDHHLPHCAIRRTCRWFEQTGPQACQACPFVITDSGNGGDTTSTARIS